MAIAAASELDVFPRPRRVRRLPGVFSCRSGTHIIVDQRSDAALLATARQLRRLVRRIARFDWPIRRSTAKRDGPAVEIARLDRSLGEQCYALSIRPQRIVIRAGNPAGLGFALVTFGQLLGAGRRGLRAMEIVDGPDFPVRGAMLDISRDKVPTMRTLRRLVDMLAGWKMNQLQLYMEHTFAYHGHEVVWRGASPMSAWQVRSLDRYCRQRGVELVPNQNSFGHMERWLRHEKYRHLSEASGGWRTPWGNIRGASTTLNPLDPRSIRLLTDLYDQLLPHFTGRLFNVGCDETFELGQGRSREACRKRGAGRVYLDHLMRLRGALRRRGRRMMYWGDMMMSYPGLPARAPKDATLLLWGYESDHAFERDCRRAARRGLEFYVCPGTSSWCSFSGRTSIALANARAAARSGKRHGAAGLLITDWGDFGHRQHLPVSYAGFLHAAAVSWCAGSNRHMDVGQELSRRAFGDATGRMGRWWCEIGDVHHLSGVRLKNRSVFFAMMERGLGEIPDIDGLTVAGIARMERRIEVLAGEMRHMKAVGGEGRLVKQEMAATIAVLRHACRRGRTALAGRDGRYSTRQLRWLAADMRRIIQTHRRLWRGRNRAGGLSSSVSYYQSNLREYERVLRS